MESVTGKGTLVIKPRANLSFDFIKTSDTTSKVYNSQPGGPHRLAKKRRVTAVLVHE